MEKHQGLEEELKRLGKVKTENVALTDSSSDWNSESYSEEHCSPVKELEVVKVPNLYNRFGVPF